MHPHGHRGDFALFSPGEFSDHHAGPNKAVEDATVQLLQLAAHDVWSVASPGPELRGRTFDEAVLHRVGSNVSKILSESSSAVIERASVIVDGAPELESAGQREIDHIATCGWPYASPCPRCYPLDLIAEAHDAPSFN